MQFHERLKELRWQKGFTQEELATQLHVSRSAVAKWENGLGLPSEESLEEIALFFAVSRESLLADRETETIIVEKNGKLSRQKKWLIALVSLACAFLIATVVLLGVFLTRSEEPLGGGQVQIMGINASFQADAQQLKGAENLRIYHLKTGETYAFQVTLSHRGSKDVRLNKVGVRVYYDPQLLVFDEGEYLDDPDPEATPTDGFPFYFTCLEAPAYTEIFVVASGYWCRVSVIIEN